MVAQTLASGERPRDVGVRLIRTIAVRPTVVDARVAVRDATSGAIGSVVIPAVALQPNR